MRELNPRPLACHAELQRPWTSAEVQKQRVRGCFTLISVRGCPPVCAGVGSRFGSQESAQRTVGRKGDPVLEAPCPCLAGLERGHESVAGFVKV